MTARRKFVIEIYHDGVVMRAHIRGTDRYLMEKAFLADLTGLPIAAGPQTGTPDRTGDFYLLDDDQLKKYGAFRQQLNKTHQD